MPIYSWRSNDEGNTPGLLFASSILDFLIKDEKKNPEFHQELLKTFHEEVVVKGSAGIDKFVDAAEKLLDVLKDNVVRCEKHRDKVRGRVETFGKVVHVFAFIGIGAIVLMMGDLAWEGYVIYKSKSECRKATAAARRKEEARRNAAAAAARRQEEARRSAAAAAATATAPAKDDDHHD